MAIVGYARVSTKHQNLYLQLDALNDYKCDVIFEEKRSSMKDRPEFQKALAYLRPGDTLVVWKLDRLSRKITELINTVNYLNEQNIFLVSITDNIETKSPAGKFILHTFGALNEYIRDINSEKTMEGLKAARKRGRIGGRPKGLSKNAKIKALAARTLYDKRKDNNLTIEQICFNLKIGSKATLYRYLKFTTK